MAGDHAEYVAPKTDGTFALKVDWSKLSEKHVAQSHNPSQLPNTFKQVITREDFEKKTLSEWFNHRAWSQESPFRKYNPRLQWENYSHRYLKEKIPSKRVFIHWILAVGVLGFIGNYGKNSAHTYAKHH